MVRLVITEKPAVARDIARALGVRGGGKNMIQGKDVWIAWCIGHIVEIAPPEAHKAAWKRWRLDTLPMLPERFSMQPIERTKSQWQTLHRLLNDGRVESVVNACDAGREGELIFRRVYHLAGCRKKVQRLWLSSLTPAAIRDGFGQLRNAENYDALADAAYCRAEADWLVGLNATRALTLRLRQGNAQSPLLSVGRVQTPTLAMLVEREAAIQAFKPEPYWQIHGHFAAPEGTYKGLLQVGKDQRFVEKSAAEAAYTALKQEQRGTITGVEHQRQREKPPLLYDLTQLQRSANQRFQLSAQQTLDAAQSLYEKHKAITYPRTDSQFLTKDMAAKLPSTVAALGQAPQYTSFAAPLQGKALPQHKRIINDAEVGDHHAIIPTESQPPGRLPANEAKVYDLIARRFLAVFYPDAIFAQTRIDTAVGPYNFVSRGRVLLEPGWLAVDPRPSAASTDKKKPGKKNEAPTIELPPVKAQSSVGCDNFDLKELKTKPPPRYSEAALLQAMEKAGRQLDDPELRRALKDAGLGTPATRANIIETLLRRNYVQRRGRHLIPTDAGKHLIGAVPTAALKNAELTGDWEAKLARMARADYPREKFMGDVRRLTAHIIQSIVNPAPHATASMPCPRCQRGQIIRGRRAWGCSRWREGCSFVVESLEAVRTQRA